jgi:chromosome segregation ATPase
MYDHVDASVANVYEQIAELQSSIQSTNQHLVDTLTQLGTLGQQVTSLEARISALEGKVEEQTQETGGIWAQIESIIGWINFIGAMLSRIEGIMVTLGLL